MKKLYASIMLGAAALSAAAQQLPNNGFESGWGDCTPWTAGNNTKTKGTTPAPWTIAQVIGMGGTGATIVGEETTGCNSAKAVKVTNTANSIASSQIVPGYFSIGKTWSTAVGTSAKNADGGTWGGYEFTYRPDAISFDYKREGNETPGTVVAYLWKGTTTQADVPGDIGLFSATKCTMTNRDRNILGMTTAQGGTVTKSADFSLIAVVNKEIATTTSDWKNLIYEFDYKNNDTPAMINVIFSAGQYFESSGIQKGNSLSVDNVKMVYYSRLASLSGVSGFAPDKYDYDLGELAEKPTATQFGYATMGHSSSAKLAVNDDAVVITVSNVGEDLDGKTQHVYTLKYTVKAAEPEVVIPDDAPTYAGYLNGLMMGESLMINDPANIIITNPEGGKCIFALKNFNFNGMDLGDIIIPDVTVTTGDAVTSYEGSRNGLVLADQIDCNVSVKGTATDAGKLNFAISVMWVMDENTQVPIDVTFTTLPTGTQYPGYLNIEMMGGKLAENQASHIEIAPTADDKVCYFILPDFALGEGADAMYIGDIVIPNVAVSEANGVKSYTGSVKGMELLGGALVADVTLNGTISADNKVKMDVKVVWEDTPIDVTFTTDALDSIAEIIANGGSTTIYDLQGRRVLTPAHGLYIINGRKVRI